ncbi:MAG: ROK family protein [Bacteroidales bacterium]
MSDLMVQALGIDLGGTKLHAALLSVGGVVQKERVVLLENRTGSEVAALVVDVCLSLLREQAFSKQPEIPVGICVPGIACHKTDTVWAPNIPGWDAFPLKQYVADAMPGTEITIASDRTCCILGEWAYGVARGLDNALFMAVGTGIGAGMLVEGRIVEGTSGIAGAIGWLAMEPPFNKTYSRCGYFETFASGNGILAQAQSLAGGPWFFTHTQDVFLAYDKEHPAAVAAIDKAVTCWGMAAANLVSLFNPEMIVWGGGVFGPAVRFLDRIYDEASQWAQPVAMKKCRFKPTALSGRAGLLGAGYLALKQNNQV